MWFTIAFDKWYWKANIHDFQTCNLGIKGTDGQADGVWQCSGRCLGLWASLKIQSLSYASRDGQKSPTYGYFINMWLRMELQIPRQETYLQIAWNEHAWSLVCVLPWILSSDVLRGVEKGRTLLFPYQFTPVQHMRKENYNWNNNI